MARNIEQGRQRLVAYRRERGERMGIFGARPKHNEASHAADGFGTYAHGYQEGLPRLKKTTRQVMAHELMMGRRW